MKHTFTRLCALVVFVLFLSSPSAKLFAQCNIITTIAGTGTAGYSGDGGAATAAKINNPSATIFDASGNMYIADYYNHRVRKVTTGGLITTVAGNGSAGYGGDGGAATSASLNYPCNLALDVAGNLYIADASNNRIRKVNTAGIINTVAGSATAGYSGDGGPATAAELNGASGVVLDAAGNMYISDQINGCIRKVNTSGIISTIAGTGTGGYSGDGGLATAGQLSDPAGLALDGAGNIFVAELSNHTVRRISVSGIITTIAGIGSHGFSGDGGPATAAEFYEPTTVALDRVGNIYITDAFNHRLRMINTSGVINTICGIGGGGFGGDGGPATSADLYNPSGVTVTASGDIYIADESNNRIRKISSGNPTLGAITGTTTVAVGSTTTLSDTTAGGTWSTSASSIASVNATGIVTGVAAGSATISYSVTNSCGTSVVTALVTVSAPSSGCNIISTFAGTGSSSYSGDGGAATAAGMAHPENMAIDGSGNIYFVEQGYDVVRKISTSGIISVIAGNGTSGFSGDGGAATAANLGNPTGVAVDAAGNLYICDNYNYRVRKVNTAGIISTVAGSGSTTSGGDGGAATSAGFSSVFYVAVDGSGNLYITDGSSKVRKVNTSGIISTFAGGITPGYSGDGGAATAAQLSIPVGMAADAAGNVFICDISNNVVRKVNTSGIISTFAGNGTAAFAGDGGVATAASFSGPRHCAFDALGNLYISDFSNYRIRKVSPSNIISTVAGNGSLGLSGDGGPATAAQFSYVYGLVTDASGNIYFPDYSYNRIRMVSFGNPAIGTITGTTTVTVGSTTTLSDTTAGGTWSSSATSTASVNSSGVVAGVAAGSATISYSVTNSCGTSVATALVTVSAASCGGIITTIAGTGVVGYSGDGGPATAAKMYSPYGVASDASGNVYISDYGNNRIRKINAAGIMSAFAGASSGSFYGDGGPATSAGLSTRGIATDAAGNIYFADEVNNRIRKINTSGIISTIAGNGTAGFAGDGAAATAANLNTPSGVAVDAAGNVYILDKNNYRIRKVNTSGIISTFAGIGLPGFVGDGGAATAARFDGPTGLALDVAGNVYVADRNNQRIRKINTSGIISTIAGNGTAGYTGDGGNATSAKLNNPYGVVTDAAGNVFIADDNNSVVRKVNASGIISTFAGNGTAGSGGDGGSATSANLSGPVAVDLDAAGNLLIVDVSGQRIRKVTSGNPTIGAITGSTSVTIASTTTLSDTTAGGIWTTSNASIASVNTSGVVTGVALGTALISYSVTNSCGTSVLAVTMTVSAAASSCNIITTIAGNGTAGYSGDGGAATAATMKISFGVTVDASGNVYFADGHNHRIRKISAAGIVSTIAGTGTGGYSGDGGYATAAQIDSVKGLAIDNAGNIYFADAGNSCIRKISSAGIITTVAGTGTSGYSGDGGQATAAKLNRSIGVWVDVNGNIYIADTYNNRVRKVNSSGIISTFAGTGTAGFSGDGSPATAAGLNAPVYVTSDAAGNVYLADEFNYCVRKVNTSGIISTVAGQGGSSGFSGDGGQATAARMNNVEGVISDQLGNLYISDGPNNRIRKVNTSGIINTVVGTGTGSFYGDGGPATAAYIHEPNALAIDGSSNIYFADYYNYRIRKVSSGNPVIGAITGTTTVTVGSSTTLSDTTTGGTWSSSATSTASVNSSGVVTGVAAGSAIITYSKTNSCGTSVATTVVTVNAAASTCNIITTIAGTGTGGYSGDGGAATAANLFGPTGNVAFDGSGNYYFADANNSRVRKVTPAGIVSTFAGNGSFGYSGDGGAATAASLNGPSSVATDASGNVYVADYGNMVIRKVNSSGIISTFAGNGSSGFSGDGGAATSAQLHNAGAVLADGSGNVYIADAGNNRVRRVNSSGIIGTFAGTGSGVYSGDGGAATAAGIYLPNSLTIDRSGNLYFAQGDPVVRKVSPSGVISLVAGSHTAAGSSGDGGQATAALLNSPSGLAVDASGNLYITDEGNQKIRVVSAGGVIGTFAGNATSGYSGDGGPATGAKLNNPRGLGVDASGNLFIADVTNNRIRKVTTGNPVIGAITGPTTVSTGSSITLSDTTAGGTWTTSASTIASINSSGVVTGVAAGTATITYSKTNSCGTSVATTVVTVNAAASTCNIITTIAGTGTFGSAGDGGTATAAQMALPFGIAVDGSGNVYFADYANQKVRKISTAGIMTTIAGTGTGGYSGDGGAATAAMLNNPYDVALDASGNIYIADGSNNRIRKISPAGIISTIAGTGTAGSTGDGGAATAAKLHLPYGVAVDGSGNVFIADELNNKIRMVTPAGIISTVAGDGTATFGGDGGAATAAQINGPDDVVVDASGNIYIADQSNSRVRKVSASGIISTIAGTGGHSFSGDGGAATAAILNAPVGIAVDRAGNVYLADFNNRIRIITTAGIINTVAGNGSATFGGDGGAATAASINNPYGIAVDASGNMFISDAQNSRIRKVTSGNPVIGAITGPTTVSTGSSITLSDTTAGVTWSSSNPAIASVSTAAVVTGITVGTVIITCVATNSCGSSFDTALITVTSVNHVPTFDGGTVQTLTVCQNAASTSINTLLSATDIDGGQAETWSTVVGPLHGTAVTAYTTISTGSSLTPAGTTYTPTSGYSGTDSFTVRIFDGTASDTIKIRVTINPLPNAGTISGSPTVCNGSSTTFTDGVSGGIWSTSAAAIASVSTTGVVTGLSLGSAIISYTVTNTCGTAIDTQLITVTATASAGTISGASSVCVAATTTLVDGTSGGTWSSGSASIATVSSAGVVTGVAAGSAVISYTVTGSCGTAIATHSITVNPLPDAGTIAGATTVCQGVTITLTDAASGGSWSSSNIGIASVNAAGLVTGVSAGSALISYTVINACGTAVATLPITVNSLPSAGTITGTTVACPGTTTTLVDAVSGGTWTTSDVAIASVSSTGIVTGIAVGSATISYAVTNSCGTAYATTTVTISSSPSAGTITGATTVCISGATTFTDGVSGGVWSTSSASVASVSSSGIVTGVSAGSATITYTVTSSCGSAFTTAPITVTTGASAGTLSGVSTFCQGSTNTLTPSVSGGTWTSSNTTIASVNTSGIVYGVGPGTATISYAITGSCGSVYVTKNQTINPLPVVAAITGTNTACAGFTATLADATTGGTWTSSNTAIATVNSSGIVTGVAVGSAVITYTVSNSCGPTRVTIPFTVTTGATAGTISGTTTVCPGVTSTLTSTVSGGSWATSAPTIASINSAGIVTGVSAGTATITYTVVSSCGTAISTTTITVSPAPNAGTITGSTTVCPGATTTLTDAASGGTWSTRNAAIASVNATGTVTGIATGGGTDTIAYTVTNSCGTAIAFAVVTVTPLPSAVTVTGTTTICTGSTTILTPSLAGGSWISGSTSIATVSAAGVVTGVANGSAAITYTITNSCGTASIVTNVTVNTTPSAGTITGSGSVCVGANTTLSNATTGGTWRSGNSTIATINSSGIVTGVSAGTVTISYVVITACGTGIATATLTVNTGATAGTITGTTAVCTGATTTLTDAATGGTWSSSNAAIATVSSAGVVTGVAAGSAVISYTVTSSCGTRTATATVTVSAPPSAGTITGTTTICTGGTATLSNAVTGGSWSTSDATIASVNAAGVVTGVAAGATIISYSVTAACGTTTATTTVTINAGPTAAAITGSSIVCTGATTTLADATTGGTWTTSDASIASVSTAGIVTGIAAGSATITYTVTSSCGTSFATNAITVNAPPSTAGTITGLSSLCPGSSTTLTNTVTGGTWSSSNNTIASVSATGFVLARSLGSATISYTVTNSCGSLSATMAVAVTTGVSAGAISGAATVCTGVTTPFTDTISGGTWASSNSTIAVVSTSGIITGVGAGTATISYTVTNSCGTAVATRSIAVLLTPSAGTISGTTALCVGGTSTLTASATGGSWSTADASVASVSAAGVVSGVSGGTAVISYSITGACGTVAATTTVTVSSGVTAGTISGAASTCTGLTTTFTDAVAGGVWSSSNASVASVDASGVVTGIGAGSATISYTVTNGCGTAIATHAITVSASPGAGTIIGASTLCLGGGATLTDAATGGTWSTSDASVVSISASGIITGVTIGSATVSYTVTGACGPVSATMVVTVTVAPSAGTITGSTSICTGATSTLTDAVTGGTWSTSNAAVASVDASGIVTGVASGSATISYTVTTTCGSAVATATVTVGGSATAGTITGASTVCVGSSTTLSDAVIGGTWSTSNAAVASVNATGFVTGVATGTAIISYSVTTACGTAVATRTIAVSAGTSAGTITGTTTLCAGATSALTDAVTGGTWSTSNAAIASVSTTGIVTGVAGGSATISYTVASSCGTISATTTVTINPSPSAGTITGASAVCAGATITLTDAVTGGSWATGSSAIASVNSTGVVTGIAAGSTVITYSVTGTCGTGTATFAITVNAMPSAGTIVGSGSVCSGSSAVLTDAATGGVWSTSNASVVSVSTTGTITGVSAGTAVVSYTVTNSCGSASATITITSGTTAPTGNITPGGPLSLCGGTPITLTAVSAAGGLSYSWYRNGTLITGATNATYSASVAGTYVAIISNSCGADTLAGVAVLPAPNPLITLTGVHTLSTGSFTSYQWYLNGVAIVGATSSTYVYSTPGVYTVRVTNAAGCAVTSAPYTVANGTGSGVTEVNVAPVVNIYPNPSNSVIHVTADVNISVAVITATGKVLIAHHGAGDIDLSEFADGMYMIMVYDENNMLLKAEKLIKVQ